MISNLKVDIIYYKTPSDFELEFNLNGCCRMRILKEKVDDKKQLVTALARDVSRSKVIIVVTDLIGEKNGVEIISSAIGYKYEHVDKLAHAIKSGDDIRAPHGCLPLVTKSGQYGGCIVECGKQSIILISSDRPLRHEIMRSYIHQYIFDINQVEAFNERLRHESENNPVIDNSGILTAARADIAAEIAEMEEGSTNESATEETVATDDVVPQSGEADEETVFESNNDTEATEEISDDSTGVSQEEEESAAEAPDDADTVYEETETEDADSPDNDTSFPIIKSGSDGFIAVENISSRSDEGNKKTNRRLMRRRKGSSILLLILAILLLLCFGVLAYFFVYKPIINGEMPNDFNRFIAEVMSWKE